jgi:hypothetical protein
VIKVTKGTPEGGPHGDSVGQIGWDFAAQGVGARGLREERLGK